MRLARRVSLADVADSCRLKDTRKELKIQMKFCHDDRALMSANQSTGREKKETSVSDRNLSAGARKYQKVTKFASRHKSPNHMWYELQKVPLETRHTRYKGAEIGTILHMLRMQGRVGDGRRVSSL